MITTIISIISIVIGLAGLIAALQEYRRANKIKRADYLDVLMKRFTDDEDVRDALYEFQYDDFTYDASFHDGGEREKKIDKAVYLLSYVCYLVDKHVITEDEFCFFELFVSQSLRSRDLIDYLFNLYHYHSRVSQAKMTKDGLMKEFSFSHLLDYGLRHGLIHKDFLNSSSIGNGKYHKYLNF